MSSSRNNPYGGGDYDNENPTDDESVADKVFSIVPDWVWDFGGTANKIIKSPAAWVISSITALSFDQVLKRHNELDQSWLEILLDYFIFRNFLLPIAEGLWGAGLAIIDAFLLVFFGGDRSVGVEPGSAIGILDVPIVAFWPLVDIASWMGDAAVAVINTLNAQIAGPIANGLGVAAPPVITALWVGEILAAAWVSWTIINSIDIPAIDEVSGLKAATRPIRNAIDYLT